MSTARSTCPRSALAVSAEHLLWGNANPGRNREEDGYKEKIVAERPAVPSIPSEGWWVIVGPISLHARGLPGSKRYRAIELPRVLHQRDGLVACQFRP